ncbi:MAG TPA: type II toxin-antitoxin system prevent-host-death family antitoxin [Gammaproteobacteria bacterium]|nr:type II toxin-antitoxin system prevent-host-death family antitoxin [Gammaproteobacteria bacterium]
MISVNIHEAKTHFSKLINQALQGEEVVIAKGGKPLVTLTPYVERVSPRKGGQLKGLIQVSADFDAPLPDEILKQFYGDDEA